MRSRRLPPWRSRCGQLEIHEWRSCAARCGWIRTCPCRELPRSATAPFKSTRARRFSALFSCFAALALAAVGIYGVVSYSVERRTREIGIRMALGAGRAGIRANCGWAGAGLGGAGVLLGVAGGLAVSRLLRSLLFGVSATDPAVFVGASLFLLAVSALAGYVPARRAARVDHMRRPEKRVTWRGHSCLPRRDSSRRFFGPPLLSFTTFETRLAEEPGGLLGRSRIDVESGPPFEDPATLVSLGMISRCQ